MRTPAPLRSSRVCFATTLDPVSPAKRSQRRIPVGAHAWERMQRHAEVLQEKPKQRRPWNYSREHATPVILPTRRTLPP